MNIGIEPAGVLLRVLASQADRWTTSPKHGEWLRKMERLFPPPT